MVSRKFLAVLVVLGVLQVLPAWGALLCAQPGIDGDARSAGIVNLYLPGPPGVSLAPGERDIPHDVRRGSGILRPGDLLLLMQMQGAEIRATDSADYGGSDGRGWVSVEAGIHEMLRVEQVLDKAVRVRGAGPNGGILHHYRWRQPRQRSDQGAARWQLVRVPQYESLVLRGDLQPLPWDGRSGGVLAVDVRRTLDFAGHAFNATASGFRGAAPLVLHGGVGDPDDFSHPAPGPEELAVGYGHHAGKAEGLAGTPRWLMVEGGVMDTLPDHHRRASDGYPGGSLARGAPGNAGGGGNGLSMDNTRASGGGGGGGVRPGSTGKNTDGQPLGGLGGAGVPLSPAHLLPGGGGGAGTRSQQGSNAASAGGVGGGIVILHAGRLAGEGRILANGSAGVGGEESGGGGGGGGMVRILSPLGSLSGSGFDLTGGQGGIAAAPGGQGGAGGLLLGGGIDVRPDVGAGSLYDQLLPGDLAGVAPGYRCRPSGTLISGNILQTRSPAELRPSGEGLAGWLVTLQSEGGSLIARTRSARSGQFGMQVSEEYAGQTLSLAVSVPEGWHAVRAGSSALPLAPLVWQGNGRWTLTAREGVLYDSVDLSLIRTPVLESPAARGIKPGNTEIFLFRYLSHAQGRVRFRYAGDDRGAGWEHAFFLDPECTGASQYVDENLTRWLVSAPDSPVCVRVRVEVPEEVRSGELNIRVSTEIDYGATPLGLRLPTLERSLRVVLDES